MIVLGNWARNKLFRRTFGWSTRNKLQPVAEGWIEAESGWLCRNKEVWFDG